MLHASILCVQVQSAVVMVLVLTVAANVLATTATGPGPASVAASTWSFLSHVYTCPTPSRSPVTVPAPRSSSTRIFSPVACACHAHIGNSVVFSTCPLSSLRRNVATWVIYLIFSSVYTLNFSWLQPVVCRAVDHNTCVHRLLQMTCCIALRHVTLRHTGHKHASAMRGYRVLCAVCCVLCAVCCVMCCAVTCANHNTAMPCDVLNPQIKACQGPRYGS